jgi:hypothetical protein
MSWLAYPNCHIPIRGVFRILYLERKASQPQYEKPLAKTDLDFFSCVLYDRPLGLQKKLYPVSN